MLEHGSNYSLPAKYRIALALSTAFLIHTLFLSGIPSIVPDSPVHHRQQLNLELISASSPQNTAAPANSLNPTEKRIFRNPPFEALPDSNNPKPIEPKLSTSQAQQKAPVNERPQATATTKKKATPAQPAAASTSPGTLSMPDDRHQVSEKKNTEEITKISRSPSEQDPYLIKLATHLAAKLETLRIPAIRELADSSTMELELQLLGNGALTRARVLKSTGIKQIDREAYQAALLASPYPPPPPDQYGKSRFEVKLVFAPSRL